MKIFFWSPVSFEPWNWENSVTTGIGGSETSVVEMSWRLARNGNEVTVYAPLPENSPNEWRNVKWLPLDSCTFSEEGLWILYRCPQDIDRFIPKNDKQILWLLLQDWDHPPEMWTKERVDRLDRIVVLCKAHLTWLASRHPGFAEKMWITRNGIKTDLIEQIEKENPNLVRNPKRIMYASSPDRGMLSALKIFKRAKEYIPDLELHLTYGFDNLNKMHEKGSKFFLGAKRECLKLIEETGAIMHGRVSQNELYKMWLQTGICLYCTNFWETGWITGLESAAMGAIPIFSPIWAQGENMKFGAAVQGDPHDLLTIARFVEAVRLCAGEPSVQDRIRTPMMEWARKTWNWDVFVKQWEEAAKEPKSFNIINPTPSISVITPSVRPEALQMTLDCLDKQTVKDWEWLISVPYRHFEEVKKRFAHRKEIRVFVEPNSNTDFYNLNKAWNQLIKHSKGEYILSAVDNRWFDENTLQVLRDYIKENPKSCVSGWGHQYDKIVNGKPENVVWECLNIQGHDGPIQIADPAQMEFAMVMFPRKEVVELNGFDETYDRVSGYSEKELCCRLVLNGVQCIIHHVVEYRSLKHEEHGEQWNLMSEAGFKKLQKDVEKLKGMLCTQTT